MFVLFLISSKPVRKLSMNIHIIDIINISIMLCFYSICNSYLFQTVKTPLNLPEEAIIRQKTSHNQLYFQVDDGTRFRLGIT